MKTPTTDSAVKCRNFAKKHFGLVALPNKATHVMLDTQVLSGHMSPVNTEKYKRHLIDAGFVLELRGPRKAPFYRHADGAVILVGTDRAGTGKHIIDFHGTKKAKVSNYFVHD